MDEAAKRTLLKQFGYGIYLLSTHHDGEDHGITATWVSQVSFKPPLVMVGVERTSRTLEFIQGSGAFGLSLLRKEQLDLAKQFVRPAKPGESKFAGLATHTRSTGVPLLKEALGFLECRLVKVCETGGDHDIVLGEVVEAGVQHEGQALHLRETGMSYGG